MTKTKISDVSSKFVRYHKKNPAWGSLHIVMEDSNWESTYGLDEWAKELGDKEGVLLAKILQGMDSREIQKLSAVIERLESGEKLSPEEQDAELHCEWCGGEVDDDGDCLKSYCKGNG